MWKIFGLIAGMLAKVFGNARERTGLGGILGAIVPGITGAVAGGDLGSRLLGWDFQDFGLAVAVAGALPLRFIDRWCRAARRPV
jgi:uncharacterized membrane protein YeaQ/YmgE (transglycosylase-associated protein family)